MLFVDARGSALMRRNTKLKHNDVSSRKRKNISE
jgi:hypothetical protein